MGETFRMPQRHISDPCDLKRGSISPIVELFRDLLKMHPSCEFGDPMFISSRVILVMAIVKQLILLKQFHKHKASTS